MVDKRPSRERVGLKTMLVFWVDSVATEFTKLSLLLVDRFLHIRFALKASKLEISDKHCNRKH